MTKEEIIEEILETLQMMNEDSSLPKNAKLKLNGISIMLKDTSDISLRISKALAELDDLQEDSNLQAFTRTQIFNVASMLEKVY